MSDELKVSIGKKAEEKPEKVGQGEKAGPIDEDAVEGQGAWVLYSCPWCGGLNRCYDTAGMDVWTCGWCGQLFY